MTEQPDELSTPVDNPDEPEQWTMDQIKKLRAEAQSVRGRLRDSEARVVELEAEREKFITQQGEAQRREVERVASEVLIDPADVWRIPLDAQQSFYDAEFGGIVADRVVESAKQLAGEKPHLARPNTAPPPSDRPVEGLRPGASPPEQKSVATWHSALRGG